MRKLFTISSFVLAITAQAQHAETVKLEQLESFILEKTDQIKVINFWATWCGPCVKEMPLFEKLRQDRPDIQVTLVSMDLDLDPNPDKVHKFIARKNIQSKVLILDAKSPNLWIDKIDKNWSGAIPATIIINGKTGQRKFIERELQEGELEKLIAEIQ